MLALSRSVGESVVVATAAGPVVLTVERIDRGRLTLGVCGPLGRAYREELHPHDVRPLTDSFHVELVTLRREECVLGFAGDRSVPVWRTEVLIKAALPNTTKPRPEDPSR